MKRYLLLFGLMVLAAAGVSANGFDYQVGFGYSTHFMEEEEVDPSAYPLGFALFGGFGYSITPNLSTGFEYEFSQTWAVEDSENDELFKVQEHLPRAYARFYQGDDFILTAFLGPDVLVYRLGDEKLESDMGFAMGLRLGIAMGYGQYTVVFTDGRVDHRLGFGIQFSDMSVKETSDDYTNRKDL
jgi:hypothetical protein